jgi:hypothetical protein
MPLYTYECGQCERREDGFRHVDERHDGPKCCGQTMGLIICPSYIQDDIPAYVSPATGRVIGSRSARRDDFKRSNCRPWEGVEQEKKEFARRNAYEEKKADARLEDAAHRAWHQLPPAKRAELDGSE